MLSRALGSVVRRSARAPAFRAASTVTLPADSNQALGIGNYAKDFIDGKYGDNIDDSVWEKIEQFHTDSVMCGISALAGAR